jgi:hypothetical protein
VSSEWQARQFSSMQEGHTNTTQKMFKQNLIKILIMRATRHGTERATRPLPPHNKNTSRYNCDCTHHWRDLSYSFWGVPCCFMCLYLHPLWLKPEGRLANIQCNKLKLTFIFLQNL